MIINDNTYPFLAVTSEILRCLPVFVGSLSGVLFEKTDKMLWIFKSEPVADLADCQQVIVEVFFGSGQQTFVDEILGSPPGLGLDQLAKVTGVRQHLPAK